jgi:Tfp pilus assembly protein PilO
MSMPLRNKTSFYTRMQCTLAVTLAVFGVVFVFVTLKPTQRQAAALAQRLTESESELAAARARASDLPRIAAENEALSLRLAQSKRLPSQQELGEFVRDISRLGNQFSLKKFEYKYGLPKRGDSFSQVPISVMFEGDMLNVYAFLKKTEELPRLTRLRNIALEAAGADRPVGTVTVQMSLNTYFAND